MIFQHTWQAVLEGRKTQTRRLIKPGEWLSKYMTDKRPYWMPCVLTKKDWMKWAVLSEYAVQPGRGKSALWWKEFDGRIVSNEGIEYRPSDTPDGYDYENMIRLDHRATWKKHGYLEARIRITDITCEDVRKISWDDAEAEGFESRKLFFDTWLSMHDKPAYKPYSSGAVIPGARAYLMTRPAERYQAWVIEFELAQS